MSEPYDAGGWKTPGLSDKRFALRTTEAGGPIDGEGRAMLPAAVVHPFTAGDTQSKIDGPSNLTDRPHLRYINLPSPYLLSTQANSPQMSSPPLQVNSPSTPVTGRITRASPKSLCVEHFRKFSPSSQELELQSLRQQVQGIQNRLNGDITASPEYQQLLNEKLTLEQTLGATEYELQELKKAFGNLEMAAVQSEEKMSQKMKEATEHQKLLVDKYNVACDELRRLKDYLQTVPTHEEHFQLQQKVTKKSKQIAHITEKFDLLSNQRTQLKESETRLKRQVDTLNQEKEDLSLKLKLSENILTDIESQKALAEEQGEDTKEDLLWRISQQEKELTSAKKLLNYRKTKIESLNKELIEQEKSYHEKMEKEVESSEKLRESVWELQRTVEEQSINEQKMKSSIKNHEAKQKKLEERLELCLTQIKSHHEMNSTITSLFSNLDKAVSTLKDLVKISSQISQGVTPDLSVLLNFTEPDEKLEVGLVSLEDMKTRLAEVHDLNQQLEEVRLTLQDQHAGQVAANMTCAQM